MSSDDASIQQICQEINFLIIEYNGSDPSMIESSLNKIMMDSSNITSKFYTHIQIFSIRVIIPIFYLIATGSCCAVCLNDMNMGTLREVSN